MHLMVHRKTGPSRSRLIENCPEEAYSMSACHHHVWNNLNFLLGRHQCLCLQVPWPTLSADSVALESLSCFVD